MTIERMSKAAGIFRMAAKVARIICLVIAALLIIMEALFLLLGDRLINSSAFSLGLNLGNVELKLAESMTPNATQLKLCIAVGIGIAVIAFLAVAYIAWEIKRMLTPAAEGRPFEKAVSLGLKRLAWFSLIFGIVYNIAEYAIVSLSANLYNLTELFNPDTVTGMEVQYNFDFGFVLFACVLFLLFYIFSYGAALQRESDETL